MASRKDEITKLDTKLSLIQSRINDLLTEHERLEEELKQKGLKRSLRESLKTRMAAIDGQIKAAQKEDWDADDQRYDLLYYPKRH
jgi:seryl-tRNA synthetase